VTINIGGGEFAHVTIWKKVAPPSNEVTDVSFSGGEVKETKTAAHPHIVGAKSDEKAIDEETKAFLISQKAAIEAKANKTYSTFNPVSYRTQVVAGMNVFGTIDIGGGHFIHVTIWKKVAPPSNEVTHVEESGHHGHEHGHHHGHHEHGKHEHAHHEHGKHEHHHHHGEGAGARPLAGGKGAEHKLDEETSTLVASQRAAIEAEAKKVLPSGAAIDAFEPVAYRSQVVAGMNYFVKIRLNATQFVKATIWKKLPPADPAVTSVELCAADAAL